VAALVPMWEGIRSKNYRCSSVGSGRRDARKLVIYAMQESLGNENLPLVVQVKEKDIRRGRYASCESAGREREEDSIAGEHQIPGRRVCVIITSQHIYSALTWGEYGLHMAWKGRCV
jgi:hypothetical protein